MTIPCIRGRGMGLAYSKIPLKIFTFLKNKTKNEIELKKKAQTCVLYKNITPDPLPLCGSSHEGLGWSETIMVSCFSCQRNLVD